MGNRNYNGWDPDEYEPRNKRFDEYEIDKYLTRKENEQENWNKITESPNFVPPDMYNDSRY